MMTRGNKTRGDQDSHSLVNLVLLQLEIFVGLFDGFDFVVLLVFAHFQFLDEIVVASSFAIASS